MATAVLGLIGHTEIDDADANTDWTELTTADADIKKEGSNAMSGILRSDGDDGYVSKGSPISCDGEHLRIWINTINAPYMEDEAGGGYEVYVSDGTNTDYVTVFGSDTYPGGWFNAVIDCSLFTTVTPGNVDTWGIRANHTTNAKNAINTWVDFVRYTDGYYATGGTSGDEIMLSHIAALDKEDAGTLMGYGIIEELEGVYFASGELQIGNGATTTYFLMDGDVLVYTDKLVADGLYKLNGNGSGADITIVNSTIKSSGTGDDNRFDVDMSTGSPDSVSITSTVFIRGGTFVFASGQTVTGCTFNDCQQITAGGADFTGSKVLASAVAADGYALYWDETTDPNGELDDMEFSIGSNAHHAIYFGASIPTSITLTGISFSGFNASDSQNDSTLYFADTSGTITLNLVGCSGNISVKTAGCTVNKVINPVAFTVTVKDNNTKSAIQYVWVTIWATATGDLPYQDSVSIARSGSTVTVTHTAHGLSTNQWVEIEGCTETDYNGIWQITKIDDDSYSYQIITTPSSPATGSPKSTAIIINGQTDGSGQISDTRSYTADQGYDGKALKGSWSPVYKEGSISGTLDKDTGASLTVLLVPD